MQQQNTRKQNSNIGHATKKKKKKKERKHKNKNQNSKFGNITGKKRKLLQECNLSNYKTKQKIYTALHISAFSKSNMSTPSFPTLPTLP